MLFSINKEEKEKAIQYLMDNIPEDCLKKVWDKIQSEGLDWMISKHFELGMYVRNTLREGGFDWDPTLFDDTWSELIRIAARRKFGTIRTIVNMLVRMQEQIKANRKAAFEKQLNIQLNRFFLNFPGRR
jgi:hypothetical protein